MTQNQYKKLDVKMVDILISNAYLLWKILGVVLAPPMLWFITTCQATTSVGIHEHHYLMFCFMVCSLFYEYLHVGCTTHNEECQLDLCLRCHNI